MEDKLINFGTYAPEDAERLKQEFQKRGISVQLVYPGTNIGREASGNTQWAAFTILISESDLDKAKQVREELGINPVKSIKLHRFLKIPAYIVAVFLLISLLARIYFFINEVLK